MSIEVKFRQDTPELKLAKVYVGKDLAKWPSGVYRSHLSDLLCVKLNRHDDRVLCLRESETVLEVELLETYTRISDDPRITSMTFAGSMNYPDGKPEGVSP